MNIIYIYVYIYIFIQYFSEQELGSHHRLCGASHARPGNRGAADACGVRKAAFLHGEGAGATTERMAETKNLAVHWQNVGNSGKKRGK